MPFLPMPHPGNPLWNRRKPQDARDVYRRTYGTPADIDKVWEDRDALADALEEARANA